jgi:uncharacterized membrane protein
MRSSTTIGLAYLAVFVAFALVDGAWIAFIAAPMFRAAVGAIMLETPYFAAAIPFYVIYALGVTALAVLPAVDMGSARRAALNGAILGLTAYGAFELTSLTIFVGWTWRLVFFDVAWGTFITAIVAMIGYWAAARSLGRGA